MRLDARKPHLELRTTAGVGLTLINLLLGVLPRATGTQKARYIASHSAESRYFEYEIALTNVHTALV